jgi:hypothetical protein
MTSLQENNAIYGVLRTREHDAIMDRFEALVETKSGIIFVIQDKPPEEPFALNHTISFEPTEVRVMRHGCDYPLGTNAKLVTGPVPADQAPTVLVKLDDVNFSSKEREEKGDTKDVAVLTVLPFQGRTYTRTIKTRTWKLLEARSHALYPGQVYEMATYTEIKTFQGKLTYFLTVYSLLTTPRVTSTLHRSVAPAHFIDAASKELNAKLFIGAMDPRAPGLHFNQADMLAVLGPNPEGIPLFLSRFSLADVIPMAQKKYQEEFVTAQLRVKLQTLGQDPPLTGLPAQDRKRLDTATTNDRTARELSKHPFTIVINLIPHLDTYSFDKHTISVGDITRWATSYMSLSPNLASLTSIYILSV